MPHDIINSDFLVNDYEGIMLLLGEFQRAGGWCEPVQKEDSNLTPESTLRRTITVCVTEYGRPVIGFGLD